MRRCRRNRRPPGDDAVDDADARAFDEAAAGSTGDSALDSPAVQERDESPAADSPGDAPAVRERDESPAADSPGDAPAVLTPSEDDAWPTAVGGWRPLARPGTETPVEPGDVAPAAAVALAGDDGSVVEPVVLTPSFTRLDVSARSLDARVCPFFRREEDGRLVTPVESSHPDNRCAAYGPPLPQSTRQQELVCLRAAHANCPRYLRGALDEPSVARVRGRTATLPRATASCRLLLASAGLSFGFVLQRWPRPARGCPGDGDADPAKPDDS